MPGPDKQVEFGELRDHTGYHIRRAHSAFMRLFASAGRDFNLRSQQASILVLTRENPGIGPASVAAAIGIERSLMTRLLNDLIERQFIESKASVEDGRQKGLFITPAGKKFIHEVMDRFWSGIEPALTGKLSKTEKQTLISLLTRVYQED